MVIIWVADICAYLLIAIRALAKCRKVDVPATIDALARLRRPCPWCGLRRPSDLRSVLNYASGALELRRLVADLEGAHRVDFDVKQGDVGEVVGLDGSGLGKPLFLVVATADVMTAANTIGLNRTRPYQMARRGEFPCELLKLGTRYRVLTSDLMHLLSIEPQSELSFTPKGRSLSTEDRVSSLRDSSGSTVKNHPVVALSLLYTVLTTHCARARMNLRAVPADHRARPAVHKYVMSGLPSWP